MRLHELVALFTWVERITIVTPAAVARKRSIVSDVSDSSNRTNAMKAVREKNVKALTRLLGLEPIERSNFY